MDQQLYQQLLGEYTVSKQEVEEAVDDPEHLSIFHEKWPDEETRRRAYLTVYEGVFAGEDQISVQQAAENVQRLREVIREQRGSIWAVLSKVKITIARNLAFQIRECLMSLGKELDLKALDSAGKESPYRNSSLDATAVRQFYDDPLALRIARDCGIEAVLP